MRLRYSPGALVYVVTRFGFLLHVVILPGKQRICCHNLVCKDMQTLLPSVRGSDTAHSHSGLTGDGLQALLACDVESSFTT